MKCGSITIAYTFLATCAMLEEVFGFVMYGCVSQSNISYHQL